MFKTCMGTSKTNTPQEQNLTLLDTSQKPFYLLFCIQRWLALILDLLVMVLAVVLMVLVVKLVSSPKKRHPQTTKSLH